MSREAVFPRSKRSCGDSSCSIRTEREPRSGALQHQIDACDAALRRLTGLVPPPYDAIEALLLAKAAAEGRLSELPGNTFLAATTRPVHGA